MQSIDTLSNGLIVIVEEMPHVESVAFDLHFPGGIICDDDSRIGAGLILAELTSRGAGSYNSRALSEAFEELGIRHGESSGFDRYVYRGSLFAAHLGRALELVSLMVREPQLPPDEIESIRSILLQDLASLSDNPARQAMVEFSERYYPAPFGRSTMGSVEGLKGCGIEDLRKQWKRQYAPKGGVLSVAGRVSRAEVLSLCESHFGSWKGDAVTLPKFTSLPAPKAHHIPYESAQLQIVLAYPSATFLDPHYYAVKMAAGVLSGGMFGRLFIEVREKRGLCYSVYARHSANNDFGTMQFYAGTTPERAHETLQVMLEQVNALKGTITDDELNRAKANLKASLVIGEESSASRASSNAGDWWLLKRVRTLDEILGAIDRVTMKDVDNALEAFPAKAITLLTLGSRELNEIYKEMA